MESKVCNNCNIEKPLTDFYWRTPKDRNGQSYPSTYCKECLKEYQRKRRETNPESYEKVKERERKKYWEKRNQELPELKAKIGKIKICSICNFEGSIDLFQKRNSKKTLNKLGLIGTCKKCYNKIQKEYKQNNPDIFIQSYKKTYARRKKDQEFMEKKKIRSKEYNQRPEVKMRKNKATMERRRANETYHIRRLLTNTYYQLGSKRPANQRTKKLIGYDGYELIAAIGEKPNGKYDIDHLIPLSWFVNDVPPHIACDLRNLEWKENKINIAKNNYYADPVSIELFQIVKPYLKQEYISRFEINGGIVKDTYREKVLELWEQGESCMVLFD